MPESAQIQFVPSSHGQLTMPGAAPLRVLARASLDHHLTLSCFGFGQDTGCMGRPTPMPRSCLFCQSKTAGPTITRQLPGAVFALVTAPRRLFFDSSHRFEHPWAKHRTLHWGNCPSGVLKTCPFKPSATAPLAPRSFLVHSTSTGYEAWLRARVPARIHTGTP